MSTKPWEADDTVVLTLNSASPGTARLGLFHYRVEQFLHSFKCFMFPIARLVIINRYFDLYAAYPIVGIYIPIIYEVSQWSPLRLIPVIS